jgi:hypothetical protein
MRFSQLAKQTHRHGSLEALPGLAVPATLVWPKDAQVLHDAYPGNLATGWGR